MRIEKITGAVSNNRERAHKAAAGEGCAADKAPPAARDGGEPGRALIAVEARAATPRHEPGTRHSAPFITQLLANRIGVPQTRARRRALPADGSAHYSAAGNLSCARRVGITDRRSI